jgi:hypothetical protein
MAKILVQFNETTSKATSQGNLDDRMISFFDDGVSNEGFAYRKANDTYMTFSSDEHIADVTNDFAASIGISWSGVATDVNAAIEEVNSALIDDHGGLTGLADDDHSQYFLLAGRTGAQTATLSTDNDGTIEGSDAANGNLILVSTSNATKGEVLIGTSTNTNALVNFPFATTAKAAISLPTSTAVDPASPNEGDLWYNGTNLYFRDSTGNCDILVGSGGDVTGPASSTDRGIPTFSGTSGKILQNNSGAVINSNGNLELGGNGYATTRVTIKGDSASVGVGAVFDDTNVSGNIYSLRSDAGSFIIRDVTNSFDSVTLDSSGIELSSNGAMTTTIVADANDDDGDTDNLIKFKVGTAFRGTIGYDEGSDIYYLGYGDSNKHIGIKSTGDFYLGNTAATTARELNISNSASTTAVSQQFTNGSSGTTASEGFLLGIDNASTPNAELVNFEDSDMIFKTFNTACVAIDDNQNMQFFGGNPTDGGSLDITNVTTGTGSSVTFDALRFLNYFGTVITGPLSGYITISMIDEVSPSTYEVKTLHYRYLNIGNGTTSQVLNLGDQAQTTPNPWSGTTAMVADGAGGGVKLQLTTSASRTSVTTIARFVGVRGTKT